jgi:hypothetical protein
MSNSHPLGLKQLESQSQAHVTKSSPQPSPGSNPCQVVSAAGAVDHDAVVQLAEKAFGGLSSDPTTAMDLIKAVRCLPLDGGSVPHSRVP